MDGSLTRTMTSQAVWQSISRQFAETVAAWLRSLDLNQSGES